LKKQGYHPGGKPILIGVRGNAAAIIDSSRAGVTCQPGDPVSIVAAVKELAGAGDIRLTEMGRNGRAFYNREPSVAVGVNRFVQILKASAFGGKHHISPLA
jgi:hypothetical protein